MRLFPPIRIGATTTAGTTGGHYSQASIGGPYIFVSGQLPITADGQCLAHHPVGIQTRQCLNNLEKVLHACGSSLGEVLRATIYVSDINAWPEVNREFAERFGAHRPARSIIPTGKLHFDCDVEIEVIAFRTGARAWLVWRVFDEGRGRNRMIVVVRLGDEISCLDRAEL